jgi:hypothetical protein
MPNLKNLTSTQAFETAIFDPDNGFGGNGLYIESTAEQIRST